MVKEFDNIDMVNKYTKVCVDCGSSNIKYVEKMETVVVRNEPIEVLKKCWHCYDCKCDYRFGGSGYDHIAEAHRIYRDKHGMLQPEKIKELRIKLGFTQGELAKIFGWGIVNISRYENGSLQSEASEKLLKLLTDPGKMYKFIEDNYNLEDKQKHLDKLRKNTNVTNKFLLTYLEENLSCDDDEFTGFQKINIDKIKNAILFFCKGTGVYKTKLNKLLFYLDFEYFKEYVSSITGMKYLKLDYGPVPGNYKHIYNILEEIKALEVTVTENGDSVTSYCRNIEEPDLSVFSDDELEILIKVKKKYETFTSKQISEISHKEKAYIETNLKEPISYLYASELNE